jgi:hemerythrin-like domain-containing protein
MKTHCGCAARQGGSTHPVDDLSAEHRVIETILAALEREAKALADGAGLRTGWLREAVSVLREFADLCHHGKEEELLFPELIRSGLPADSGPVAVMKHEHVEGRALLQRLDEAVARGDRGETGNAIGAYVWLLRQHIWKEDNVLFPHARQTLPADVVAQLRSRFDAFEREFIGEGRHCRHLERAQELCAQAAPAPAPTTAGQGSGGRLLKPG